MENNAVIRNKVMALVAEAKYRFGGDVIRIINWLEGRAKRAYQMSDSVFDASQKVIYRSLGDAITSFIADADERAKRHAA